MNHLKKAILKTLNYYDIFHWPLNLEEVHQFLIEEKANLLEVKKALPELIRNEKVEERDGLYFLVGKGQLAQDRLKREKIAQKKIRLAQKLAQKLKIIPWIELIGLTGALAVGDAQEEDDLDFLIITQTNRLYLSRFFEFLLFTLLNKRRKPRDQNFKDKVCPNLYLDHKGLKVEENLAVAHDLVRLKVLWEKNETYQDLINQNRWIKKYFPNFKAQRDQSERNQSASGFFLGDWIERFFQVIQVRYMKPKKTVERVSSHALYFHPQNTHQKILEDYRTRISPLDN